MFRKERSGMDEKRGRRRAKDHYGETKKKEEFLKR
jgi:hypothetical protein